MHDFCYILLQISARKVLDAKALAIRSRIRPRLEGFLDDALRP